MYLKYIIIDWYIIEKILWNWLNIEEVKPIILRDSLNCEKKMEPKGKKKKKKIVYILKMTFFLKRLICK